MAKPNVILFDTETSNMIVATFSLYPESIGHHDIIEDWYMFCVAYKKLGEKKIHSVALTDDPKRFKKDQRDDFYVVKTMADIIKDADVIVGHNLKNFDVKKLNTRLIKHGLPPLPKIPVVDTLKEARKIAKFSSNRLDYLGEFFGFGGKVKTSPELWMRALHGDVLAIEEMAKYCKGDVDLLEKIYLKLLPYIETHPHIGVLSGEERFSCNKCGSTKLIRHKERPTATGLMKIQCQCQKCGSYSTFSEKLTQVN